MNAPTLRVAGLLLFASLVQCTPPPTARHALVIVVDTLRADALGLYGSPWPTSPNVDAFGARSLVFDHAWAQGTYTPSSYVSYMTSTWVRTHGWDFPVLAPVETGICGWTDLVTLPEVLARHGFTRTAFVANPHLTPKLGFPRGFEIWNGLDVEALGSGDALPSVGPQPSDSEVVERAREAVFGWEAGRRHFLYVHLMTPHLPLAPSDGARQVMDLPEHWSPDGRLDVDRVRALERSSTREQRDWSRTAYYASVWDGDRHIGRILSALAEAGHEDDTVVVLLSDHGESLWEHGEYGHNTGVWETLARVPLVIRAPGVRPERRSDRPVALIDVAPTVISLLGIDEQPDSWQGENLLGASRRQALFTERLGEVAVTVDGRHKAMGRGRTHDRRWRVFDVRNDPAEHAALEAPPDREDLPALYAAWSSAHPIARRDLDAPPVGFCAELTEAERRERVRQLRALGYVE